MTYRDIDAFCNVCGARMVQEFIPAPNAGSRVVAEVPGRIRQTCNCAGARPVGEDGDPYAP